MEAGDHDPPEGQRSYLERKADRGGFWHKKYARTQKRTNQTSPTKLVQLAVP